MGENVTPSKLRRIEQSSRSTAFPSHIQFHYFCIVFYMVSLLLGGFSVINIGQRGIQLAWVLGLFVVGLSFISLISGNRCIYRDNIIVVLLILVFSFFISIKSPFLSGDSSRFVDFFTTFLQFLLSVFVFFAFTSYKMSPSYVEKIARWYIVTSALMAAFAILQLVCAYFGHPLNVTFTNESWVLGGGQKIGYETVLGNFRRSAGLFREPRQLGAYLMGGLSISAYCLIAKSSRFLRPSRQIFLFVVIFFGLLSTFSLSAYIVGGFCLLIVAGVHFQFISNNKWIVRIAPISAMIVFVAFLLWQFTDVESLAYWRRFKLPDIGHVWQVFVDLVDRSMARGPYARYVGNMSFAFHLLKDHPLLGVGINNLEYFEMKGYHGAHQPWALFGQCGFVGVFGFVAFILIFLSRIRRLKNMLRKFRIQHKSFYTLLDVALLFVLLAPIKGMASLFVYFGNFFWFDMTLAGIIYFNLKREIYRLIRTREISGPNGHRQSMNSSFKPRLQSEFNID